MKPDSQALLFAGNITRDVIVTQQEGLYVGWGGGALYGCLSASQYVPRCGILSRIGTDFPLKALAGRGLSIKGLEVVGGLSSLFYTNEQNGQAFFINAFSGDWSTRDVGQVQHLHVSCRRGIPIREIMKQVRASSRSCDVTSLSIGQLADELAQILPEMTMVFCTRAEYLSIESCELVGRAKGDTLWVITDGPRRVVVRKENREILSIQPPIIEQPYRETGAGDMLAGAVLGALVAGMCLHDALAQGIAVAQLGMKGEGVAKILAEFF